MRQVYLDMILMIERLQRQLLEVVKAELDRIGVEDINNVQALILSHVGEEELTVGELTYYRGYYLGSNVSYNVKKMVKNDYLIQDRSAHDRRSVRVRVLEMGLKICQHIQALYDRHVEALRESTLAEADMEARGMGDLAGVRQSGVNLEGVGEDDVALLIMARELIRKVEGLGQMYVGQRGRVTP